MDIQTPNKRRRNSDDNTGRDTDWPRYLIIHEVEEEGKLAKLSLFAVQKGIVAMAGEPTSVKRLRSGDILVEVGKKSHAENLIKTKSFVNIPVKVSPHNTLNSSRGVIRCPELKFCDEDEILENLASQKVTTVKKITIRRDGNEIKTGTVILTFSSPTLPPSIKVGYLNIKVDQYIPNPLRCYRCQRFGHTTKICKREPLCPKCGQKEHVDQCQNPIKCINCSEDHPAFSKTCPKWKEEKEIQTIKTQRNISYTQAREIIKARTSNTLPQSFASVVQKKTTSVAVQTESTPTQTRPQSTQKKSPAQTPPPQSSSTSRSVTSTPSTSDIGNTSRIIKLSKKKDGNRPPKGERNPIIHLNKFVCLDPDLPSESEEEMETSTSPKRPLKGVKGHTSSGPPT